MVPLIPIFPLAASWYGTRVALAIKKLSTDEKKTGRLLAVGFCVAGTTFAMICSLTDAKLKPEKSIILLCATVLAFCAAAIFHYAPRLSQRSKTNRAEDWSMVIFTLIVLFIFSSGQLFSWAQHVGQIRRDIATNELKVLESKSQSVKANFSQISGLTRQCRGIMALESTFFGAFSELPTSRIYSPWEIPPFGRLHQSVYSGLNPSRVDCVIVSSGFREEVGLGTNLNIRFQNYIAPYLDELRLLGAKTHDIKNFGQVVILTDPDEN
jgi:hypothetical protein